ncbi:MAG: tetratricopeptide repeat-containing protein [Rhizorhabdus sp.]
MTGPSEAEADRQAGAALGRGDLLAAFDLASCALASGAQMPGLVHKRLLALARMGDTRRALEEANRIGLADRADEDSVALHARLMKDLALAMPPEARRDAVLAARDAYARAYALDHGYYSAINAASLSLLGGEQTVAEHFASAVLVDPRVAVPTSYYAAATAVEALLLLGRAEEAAAAVVHALALSPTGSA